MAKFFPIDGYEAWPVPAIAAVTAQIVSTELAPANDKRLELILTNHGTQMVWVNINAPAEVGKGLNIPPNGGQLTIGLENDGHGWRKGAVNGIVASIPGSVATFEQSVP